MNLIGVFSPPQKILMILSAETDVKPENLRFLNRRFIDGLVVIYKDFGVIAYEFIGQDKFAILRHGEIIVYKITQNGTEKIQPVLLDLEIDRLIPKSLLVAYRSSDFNMNSVIKVNDIPENSIVSATKLEFSGFEKELNQVLISESQKHVALVFTNKIVFLSKFDADKPHAVKTMKNLRVK